MSRVHESSIESKLSAALGSGLPFFPAVPSRFSVPAMGSKRKAEDEDPREPLKSMLAKVEDLLNSHERAAVKDERARAEALEKKEKLMELKSRQIANKEKRLSDWEADLQAREQALIDAQRSECRWCQQGGGTWMSGPPSNYWW